MNEPLPNADAAYLSPTAVAALVPALAEQGRLLEAGFAGLRLEAIPPNAPAMQLTEMRRAFFAGAHHTLCTLMQISETGKPDEEDRLRLKMILNEIRVFMRQIDFMAAPTQGSA